MPTPNPVFICYAHKDNDNSEPSKRWLDRLCEHLEPLVQEDNITLCSDQDIELGDDFAKTATPILVGVARSLLQGLTVVGPG